MRTMLLITLVLAASAVAAQGQRDATKQAEALLAAQERATASAARPGDENLSCEQLQTEMVAIGSSPEMQASAQRAGAGAQKDMAKMEEARQQQAAGAAQGIGRSLIQGAAQSVPGVGNAAASAQIAVQAARNTQIQAEGAARMQQKLDQSSQLTANVGPMMRGMHVMELAQARNCAWIQGQRLSPGMPSQNLPAQVMPPQSVPAPRAAPASR